MTRTVTRLFDSHTEALAAVEDLERAGVDHRDISLVSNNHDNWHAGHEHPAARTAADDEEVAEDAGKGAAVGGVLGGGVGFLAGLGILAIPGLGPVAAAGWLTSTAVGLAAGAAAGAATGGLVGALKEAGHTDDEANVYSEGVRRGGTLISVRVDDDRAQAVEAALANRAGVDADLRGARYRETGWTRFDPAAAAYSADEIARERGLARETRTFSGERTTGEVGDGGHNSSLLDQAEGHDTDHRHNRP